MRLGYFFSETFTNLRRNVLMTVAAISTVAISLLLLGGVQILTKAVDNMTLSWEAQVEIALFLRDDATQGEIDNMQTDIVAMPEVSEVSFVSKDEAYEEFKQQWRNQPEFYEVLPKDALPASLRIKLHDADDTEEVAARLVGAPGVGDVRFGGQFIKTLLRVNSFLRTVSLVMSIVLLTAAIALIANTIRLGVYARRDEISIMKLVGATNWFIRIPFMLEGVFAALVGAAVAGGMVIVADVFVFPKIGETFRFLRPVFTFSNGEIFGIMFLLVGVGTLVGVIGSTLALRRFLEV